LGLPSDLPRKLNRQQKNSVVSEEQEQPSESAKQLSEKEQIQKLVSDQLKGTNNMGNPYVKKLM